MLLEAWEIFEEFEYGWRAAHAAMLLARATRDEKWLARAARRIQPWPNSWIAQEVRRVRIERAPQPHVSPAQRQVLDLLRSGKRNAEIARILRRSPHTIRNHIADLFQIFKVKSRAELVAMLAGGPTDSRVADPKHGRKKDAVAR